MLNGGDVTKYEYIIQTEPITCYKQTQIQIRIGGARFLFFFPERYLERVTGHLVENRSGNKAWDPLGEYKKVM